MQCNVLFSSFMTVSCFHTEYASCCWTRIAYLLWAGDLLQVYSNHKEVDWQEVLELPLADWPKLPSIAATEGGKNDASKNFLFNSRFPLSSPWLCAVKSLDSSPQLCTQICSKYLAATVLHTQGRGKKGFHHLNCFSLVLSLLYTSTPSMHATFSLPHNSECMLPNQAPSSLNWFLQYLFMIHTGLCRLTPLRIYFLLLWHTAVHLQYFSSSSCLIESWYF